MLKELADKLREIRTEPAKIADFHLELGAIYAELCDKYIERMSDLVLAKKLTMVEAKSVSQGKADYELSEAGIWEKKMKLQMDGLEKLLSSAKRGLDSYNTQARNMY